MSIKKKRKSDFWLKKQLLRERFKVALKEIGKEKIMLNFFFIHFDFLPRHVLV